MDTKTIPVGAATVGFSAPTYDDKGELHAPPDARRMLGREDTSEKEALEEALEQVAPLTVTLKDNVVLPKHYARYKIEPIRFSIENGLDGFQFNIVKYVTRHDAKNGLEDLRKAKRYLEMYIKYIEGDPDWWR
nr:DUF3310 domain-containing protein [uncultured Gellertiella sp.]